jgi:hypothetical protein
VSHFVLDPSASKLHIFTFAEGLFARLAHDLRLTVTEANLTAERAPSGEAKVHGSFPLSAIRVDGVMKDGTLREDVLTSKDCAEILEKMKSEVFGGARSDATLKIEATLTGDTVRLVVAGPNGRSSTGSSKVTGASAEGSETVHGNVELSVRELSGHDVKGPLGAFRIADHVRVAFDAKFNVVP